MVKVDDGRWKIVMSCDDRGDTSINPESHAWKANVLIAITNSPANV